MRANIHTKTEGKIVMRIAERGGRIELGELEELGKLVGLGEWVDGLEGGKIKLG